MLISNFEKHACNEVLVQVKEAMKDGIVNDREVPQIKTISDYMESKTGWQIKPVKGLVSPRDFLEGTAHKVFCSTVFIRNEEQLLFTSAPDFIHEIFGHCLPLLVPELADLCHLIGSYSIGATDKEIQDLGKLFWFTNEIGLLFQNG